MCQSTKDYLPYLKRYTTNGFTEEQLLKLAMQLTPKQYHHIVAYVRQFTVDYKEPTITSLKLSPVYGYSIHLYTQHGAFNLALPSD